MNQQDDLKAVASFTKGLASVTGDQGALMPAYRLDVAVEELAASGEVKAATAFVQAGNAALKAKADMVRACSAMAQEADGIAASVKAATSKINDAAGKMAQSLERTKTVMGPQVEERLKQMERFVACMERLAQLEADGTIARFAGALTARGAQ